MDGDDRRVRSVIADSTGSGSMSNVAASMSTNTGVAPRCEIGSAVAMNVCAEVDDLVAWPDAASLERELEGGRP